MAFKATAKTPVVLNYPENATKILVDCKSVAYKALYGALSQYTDPTEIKNATLFNFLDKLRIACKAFKSNRLIFCWDSPVSYRRNLLPTYKAKDRADDPASVYKPFFITIEKEILPSLGFKNSFNLEGLEADDVLAILAKQEKKLPVCIFSDDADMYQLITNNVYHMSVKRSVEGKKPAVLSVARFEEMFGINPNRWADVMSISGCTFDSVPGVEGVGKIGATAYLNGTLKRCLKTCKIEQSADVIAFTRRLVQLPFEGSPTKLTLVPDELNKAAFVKMATKYECISLLDSPFWNKMFAGEK